MPNIIVDGPQLNDVSKKRDLVKRMTDAAVEAYGLPKETIVVVIRENAPENVGVGGQLVADRVRGL